VWLFYGRVGVFFLVFYPSRMRCDGNVWRPLPSALILFMPRDIWGPHGVYAFPSLHNGPMCSLRNRNSYLELALVLLIGPLCKLLGTFFISYSLRLFFDSFKPYICRYIFQIIFHLGVFSYTPFAVRNEPELVLRK